MTALYELSGPTDWACAPALWSHSSLEEIAACPRRWQFLRSRWGEHERFPVREHPAAVEGKIVHEALDRLTRACGRRGNPVIGSELFRDALAECQFSSWFALAVDNANDRQAAHPRPGPSFVLRTPPQELANRAVRLFRERYVPSASAHPASTMRGSGVVGATGGWGEELRRLGALSEVELRHPSLPFRGVLDRVTVGPEGIGIEDYKTGAESARHETQLRRYAVLWWRATGMPPTRITAQYLGAMRSWSIEESGLVAEERALESTVAAASDIAASMPARARPSSSCGVCPVRARCDDGWALAEPASAGRDCELDVVTVPGPHGFIGASGAGREVAVVYAEGVKQSLPAFGAGARVRVVGATPRAPGTELEVRPWTEVFVVGTGLEREDATPTAAGRRP